MPFAFVSFRSFHNFLGIAPNPYPALSYITTPFFAMFICCFNQHGMCMSGCTWKWIKLKVLSERNSLLPPPTSTFHSPTPWVPPALVTVSVVFNHVCMCHRILRYTRCTGCTWLTFIGDSQVDCLSPACANSRTHPRDCPNCRCRRWFGQPERVVLHETPPKCVECPP
ncbi:hypothetical protein BD410DRAFT_422417 [Rickenella mellea]|uniref:Uncharacterized protein n=1 Tax=Rickenella mellea TaxID=50990 RepID=A0A4Y7QJR5_9AGAM|nr:hypothetical protein BD410DRAFT_422417 [Rickenella mellea]